MPKEKSFLEKRIGYEVKVYVGSSVFPQLILGTLEHVDACYIYLRLRRTNLLTGINHSSINSFDFGKSEREDFKNGKKLP